MNTRPVQDVQGIFNSMTRACSAFDQKLKLIQDPSCEQPYTDLIRKTVHVPQLRVYWPDEQVKIWRGYTTHEVGHHAPEVQDTAPFLINTKMNYETPFGRIMNVLDDVRNELNPRVQQFPGFRDDLSWTQGYHALKGFKSWESAMKGGGVPPEMLPFLEALAFVYKYRGTVQPHVAHPSTLWETAGVGVKYYHLLQRLEDMKTIEDVFELAQEFVPYEESDHDKSDDSDKEQSGNGERQEGDEETDGEGSSGAAKPGEEGDEQAEGDVTLSYKDMLSDEHSNDGGGAAPINFNIVYDHERCDDFEPHSRIEVKKARDLDNDHRGWRAKGTSAAEINAVIDNGQKLSARARRLFQAQTQSRITHNHRSGRLDKRDLYRIPSGGQDVFKRREVAVSTEGIAIFLLGDASGSMCGAEYDCMAGALTLLHESVTPLGIPAKIALFTDNGLPEHYVIKEWDERRSREDMVEDFGKVEHEMGSNSDGESVMWAYRELMKRPEKRKVLIVMSDGQPASSASGDCWTYTRDVVAHIGKHVECYGIGIMSNSVEDFYPEYTVLNKPDELEQCLLDVIKQKVFN